MCTLIDMEYVLFHATINTIGDKACMVYNFSANIFILLCDRCNWVLNKANDVELSLIFVSDVIDQCLCLYG